MARIRHKSTLHELTVPDSFDPKAYPDYELVQSEANAEEKPTKDRRSKATETE